MAGGGGNQMQQPGGGYSQAIGAGSMGGMNPNQPTLQRPIGTMGPGAGMAPTQTGLGAQGTLAPPNMGMAPPMGPERQAPLFNMPQNNPYAAYMTPTQSQSVAEMRAIMTDPMPRQIGTMGPGAGMASMPQQVPQADPRMEYMKQLYSGQQNQQQMPQPMPSQIGTMGPGAGMNQQNPYAGMTPQQRQAFKQEQNTQRFLNKLGNKPNAFTQSQIGTMGPGAGAAPTIGGIGSLAPAVMSGLFK